MTNLIIVAFDSRSCVCDPSMPEYENLIIPILVLAVGGLAALAFLLRRGKKPHSDIQDQSNDLEDPSNPKQAVDQAPTEISSHDSVAAKSPDEIEKAREELNTLSLQRQILSSALTAVFEAEAQGKISRKTRDDLVETYKAQTKALDEQITEKKRITELSDLVNEREELIKNFQQRITEIDGRLQQLNSPPGPVPAIPSVGDITQGTVHAANPPIVSSASDSSEGKKPAERAKSRAEERIDAIREEVLRAIERLEKIESEG